MRDILLAVGGYTPNECLNSFPLKYRPCGTKSITQWFHMWSYKFAVMLNHMPFLDNMSEAAIDNMSIIFAATAVAAGLPTDIRDIVCTTVFPNINSFLQECTSLCPKPGSHARHTTSHQSYGYHPHSSSHGNYHSNHTHRARYSTDYHQPRQSYSSHTPQGMDHTQSRQAYP